jgi:hypothetical protein
VSWIAYYAPGSGLGHLNRGLAVCLALRELGHEVQLLANSPFARGVAGLAKCPVVGVAPEEVESYLARHRPGVLVMDTFAEGLRGERPRARAMVHVARRLRRPVAVVGFDAVIQAEPLAAEQEALLPVETVRLPGPIRLEPGQVATPVPRELDRDGLHLVVHSGPATEVAQLVALAPEPRAVIHLNYYPACNVMGRAAHVYTGAGYNSMADMLGRANHTAVPFPRSYDDQAARRRGFFTEPIDGTALAARTIASLLP